MTVLTTSTSSGAWRPDQYSFAPADAVPDALILAHSTVAGNVIGDAPAVRVAHITDDTADWVDEAASISESDPVLGEKLVYTRKIAQRVVLSSQQFRQPETASQVAQSTARAVVYKADRAFLSQAAPVGPAVAPSAGILNIAGVNNGGELADDLDNLVDLLATIQANRGNPTAIVVDPYGWAELRKLKVGSDFNSSLLGAGVTDAPQSLLGVPVVVNPECGPGDGYVLDRTAIVSAVSPVEVATSEHAAFSSDQVMVRITWTIGWQAVRPERLGKFTIAGAGS